MPRVAIEASAFGPSVELDAPEGGRLLDLCDEARAPIPFSCRSASCGTCRVRVLAGASLLAPPSRDERETLSLFDAPLDVRLACVALVEPREGLVRLVLADDVDLEGA